MAQAVEINVVPEVTRDRYGRRRDVRVFSVDAGAMTADVIRGIVANPESVDLVQGGVVVSKLPKIGEPYQPGTTQRPLANMSLEFYSARVNGQELILTANYSSDFDDVALEMSYSNVNIPIPYAVKIPTGASSITDGGQLAYTYTIQEFNLNVAMKRFVFNKRMNRLLIPQINEFVNTWNNQVFKSPLVSPPESGGSGRSIDNLYWKLEGVQVSHVGPGAVNVRYDLIVDPGTRSIRWPSAFADDNKFVYPSSDIGFDGSFWIRPPFYTLKIIPGDPPPNNIYNPATPVRPKFIAIPSAIVEEAPPLAPSFPGVPFPLNYYGDPSDLR